MKWYTAERPLSEYVGTERYSDNLNVQITEQNRK